MHHSSPNYFLNVRSIKKSEEDIPVPPLIKSAALWGMHYLIIPHHVTISYDSG